ncbi:M24 family metallopeptidase [Pseudarthrobacter sp. YAF2]|uniref:M24 family metallopeptidase n=1 Tax=Pseudarthrobacter sp. YAF2 TaxID=3233078 RepID=UPI003F944B1C
MTVPASQLSANPLPAPPSGHLEHVAQRLRGLMNGQGLDAVVAFGPRNHYYVSGMIHPLLYDGVPTGCAMAVLFADPENGRGLVEMEFMAPGHTPAPDLDIRTYSTWTYIDNPYNLPGVKLDPELTSKASLDKALAKLSELLRDRPGIRRVGVDVQQMHAIAWTRLQELMPGIEFVNASPVFSAAQAIKSPWEIEQLVSAHDITQAAVLQASLDIEPGITVEALNRRFAQEVWAHPDATGIRFSFITVGADFSPSAQTHRRVEGTTGDIVKFDLGAEVNGYGADIARNFVIGAPSSLASDIHDALKAAHEVLVAGAVPGRPFSDLYSDAMKVANTGLPRYKRGHLGHSTGLEVEMNPHVSLDDKEILQPGMVLSLELPYYGYGVGAFNIEDMIVVRDQESQVLTTASKDLESR